MARNIVTETRKLLSIRPATRLTCVWLPGNDPRSPLTCVWHSARAHRPAPLSSIAEESAHTITQGGQRCA
jgi:hypothetical protein